MFTDTSSAPAQTHSGTLTAPPQVQGSNLGQHNASVLAKLRRCHERPAPAFLTIQGKELTASLFHGKYFPMRAIQVYGGVEVGLRHSLAYKTSVLRVAWPIQSNCSFMF
jgi:hypothetical protein